jgi:hypothetical protein
MAPITDLTWAQLQDASGSPGLMVFDDNLGLVLRLSFLTGVTYSTLNNAMGSNGVVQALYQLREWAAAAQVSVNTGKSIGDRLAAFPPASHGTALNGFVMSSGQIVTRTPLATTGIVGASN